MNLGKAIFDRLVLVVFFLGAINLSRGQVAEWHPDVVWSAPVHSSGNVFLAWTPFSSASGPGQLYSVNHPAGQLIVNPEPHRTAASALLWTSPNQPNRTLAVRPDGSLILGAYSKLYFLSDLGIQDGAPLDVPSPFWVCALIPGTQFALLGSAGQLIKVDLTLRTIVAQVSTNAGWLAVSPDGGYVCVAEGTEGRQVPQLRRTSDLSLVTNLPEIPNRGPGVFLEDGSRLVIASIAKKVIVIDYLSTPPISVVYDSDIGGVSAALLTDDHVVIAVVCPPKTKTL